MGNVDFDKLKKIFSDLRESKLTIWKLIELALDKKYEASYKEKLIMEFEKFYFFENERHDHFFNKIGRSDTPEGIRNYRIKLKSILEFFEIHPSNIHKDLDNSLLGIPNRQEIKSVNVLKLEDNYIEDYSKNLLQFFKLGKTKSLKAYNYVGGNVNALNQITVRHTNAHQALYPAIEKCFGNQGFQYTRVFALSPREGYWSEINETEALIYFVGEILKRVSFSMIQHIVNLINKPRASFYIAYNPNRLYHYGLIDIGIETVIISEYYRYRANGEYSPDILYIEKVHQNENDKLLNTYKEEFNKITTRRNRAFKLSGHLIKEGISYLLDGLIESFKEKQLEEIHINDEHQKTLDDYCQKASYIRKLSGDISKIDKCLEDLKKFKRDDSATVPYKVFKS